MRSKEFFTSEKKLSKKQKSKKEKYVKGMKKSAKDFKKRYPEQNKTNLIIDPFTTMINLEYAFNLTIKNAEEELEISALHKIFIE